MNQKNQLKNTIYTRMDNLEESKTIIVPYDNCIHENCNLNVL